MTRRVKVIQVEGKRFFTLKNKGELIEDRLCNHCGKSDKYQSGEMCWINQSVKQINHHGEDMVSVDKCPFFQPVLNFIPPLENLSGKFNTFRLGIGHFQRLDLGDSVALYDSKVGRVFDAGEVCGLYGGKLTDMLKTHAKNNHSQIGNTLNPVQSLRKVIDRLYGPTIATDNSMVSVIYINTKLSK